jgi:hypothetical protein
MTSDQFGEKVRNYQKYYMMEEMCKNDLIVFQFSFVIRKQDL